MERIHKDQDIQNEKTEETPGKENETLTLQPLDQRASKPEPLLGLQLPHSHATAPSHRVLSQKGTPPLKFGLMPSCRLLDILNNFILGPAFVNEILWNNGAGLWAKMCMAATSTCGAVKILGALWVKPVGIWTQETHRQQPGLWCRGPQGGGLQVRAV